MEKTALTDREIVAALLGRDSHVTYTYLYRKCYPLFKAIFDKYHTDCDEPVEFINEIYVFIMEPNPESGRSKLMQFGYRCTLTMWLKIVAENYCRAKYAKKSGIFEESLDEGDRLAYMGPSLEMSFKNLDASDLAIVLEAMPNERYRRLIALRYLEEKSNEETAQLLEMTMDNYYNKHKLAKSQFCAALRKEGII